CMCLSHALFPCLPSFPQSFHFSFSSLPLAPFPAPLIFPLSLHDALPISRLPDEVPRARSSPPAQDPEITGDSIRKPMPFRRVFRSEEHTSELQSRFDLVCRLLLEKKKKK